MHMEQAHIPFSVYIYVASANDPFLGPGTPILMGG